MVNVKPENVVPFLKALVEVAKGQLSLFGEQHGHAAYTRRDPRSGKTVQVQAKNPPAKKPEAQPRPRGWSHTAAPGKPSMTDYGHSMEGLTGKEHTQHIQMHNQAQTSDTSHPHIKRHVVDHWNAQARLDPEYNRILAEETARGQRSEPKAPTNVFRGKLPGQAAALKLTAADLKAMPDDQLQAVHEHLTGLARHAEGMGRMDRLHFIQDHAHAELNRRGIGNTTFKPAPEEKKPAPAEAAKPDAAEQQAVPKPSAMSVTLEQFVSEAKVKRAMHSPYRPMKGGWYEVVRQGTKTLEGPGHKSAREAVEACYYHEAWVALGRPQIEPKDRVAWRAKVDAAAKSASTKQAEAAKPEAAKSTPAGDDLVMQPPAAQEKKTEPWDTVPRVEGKGHPGEDAPFVGHNNRRGRALPVHDATGTPHNPKKGYVVGAYHDEQGKATHLKIRPAETTPHASAMRQLKGQFVFDTADQARHFALNADHGSSHSKRSDRGNRRVSFAGWDAPWTAHLSKSIPSGTYLQAVVAVAKAVVAGASIDPTAGGSGRAMSHESLDGSTAPQRRRKRRKRKQRCQQAA